MLNDCQNYIDPFSKPRKVYFKDTSISFDGTPFYIIGTKAFDCKHGPDRKKVFKSKLQNAKKRSVIVMLSTVEVKYISKTFCHISFIKFTTTVVRPFPRAILLVNEMFWNIKYDGLF